MNITRRAFCGGLAAMAWAGRSRAETGPVTHDLLFHAMERQAHLLGDIGPSTAIWSFTDELFPTLRIAHGDRLRVTLRNDLPEHTSIHWHGVRVPNAMDGVQYVTQPPVEPGGTFIYDITPPDTGTFFFHPHCNESGQVGHGLAGLLIVEGDESEPYDGEIALIVKDWRLKPDGSYLDFVTDKGAGTGGTFGTVRSVNGAINKVSWPNDGHRNLPRPLARLDRGVSYRFTLENVTPHPHPIHLHGHTFKVLSSSRRDLPIHYADTVLVMPKERIDIAFVAREGNWMFHCHILEHLGTGMMGYFHIA